jgi:hypothetical protein
MGNTPNNNFPFPESTDLVKDGAQAIEDLADAIDTTLGVYAPSTPGLTLINTTSFSAVASQSVNDVFSTTYTNYLLVAQISSAASPELRFRLRVGGTDNSANNYVYVERSASAFYGPTTATSARLGQSSTTNGGCYLVATLFRPFEAQPTGFSCNAVEVVSTMRNSQFDGEHQVSTSFTGFSIIPSTSTITGVVSTFGYNK